MGQYKCSFDLFGRRNDQPGDTLIKYVLDKDMNILSRETEKLNCV